ncbi:MAG: type II toxin-antitoxin system VapC family toxin [Candidatus Berkiella sp.]
MNYLLDTHVILWWLTEPKNISTKARKIISDKEENIFISSASCWEMAIKKGVGRLKFPANLLEILTNEGFDIISISASESLSVADLPLIHHDPFDRMLIIQAKLNDMVLITRDETIMKYPVITLKA